VTVADNGMEDPGSAIWAMIIMIVILTIVMIFFCMVSYFQLVATMMIMIIKEQNGLCHD